MSGFHRILAATDFSPHALGAVRQAVWLSRQSAARLTLAHVLPSVSELLQSASAEARDDLLGGAGTEFQREVRRTSDTKLRQTLADLEVADLKVAGLADRGAEGLGANVETLLGEPYVALTHAVQAEKHDLVIAGLHGLTVWQKLFVGSTAKRLIRNCPASVWVVPAEHSDPPRCVLAATDFSPVSRKAVLQAEEIARHAGAALHLLHVIDTRDVPDDMFDKLPRGVSLRAEVNATAERRLAEFIESLAVDAEIQPHLSWGAPWKEICHTAAHLNTDLIALGTVGRSGVPGLLLGNTAEKVLESCGVGLLTAKADEFVSPIDPPFWPLHPTETGGST